VAESGPVRRRDALIHSNSAYHMYTVHKNKELFDVSVDDVMTARVTRVDPVKSCEMPTRVCRDSPNPLYTRRGRATGVYSPLMRWKGRMMKTMLPT
jgi:hypothetical protein